MILLKKYYINTTAAVDCIPVTHEVHALLRDANCTEGLITVAVPEPGAGVTIGEAIPEVMSALKATIQQWCTSTETSGAKDQWQRSVETPSRVLSALLGRTVQIPVASGKLVLNAYSDVLCCDFESKPQRREIIVQVMSVPCGEAAAPQPEGDEYYD